MQIAKALGASVTAVCSTRNLELVRTLGAEHVIDYTQEDYTRQGRHYDVIFDLAAFRPFGDNQCALVPGGTYVLGGGERAEETPSSRYGFLVVLSALLSVEGSGGHPRPIRKASLLRHGR